MRESIGATWIFGIVITFIALFSGYLAISINYSKAQKLKDDIIENLERYNGVNTDSLNEINQYIDDIGYASQGVCGSVMDQEIGNYLGFRKNSTQKSNMNPKDGNFNYCIQKVPSMNKYDSSETAYYRVSVFFTLSLPVLNTSSRFSVTGETVSLRAPSDKDYFIR